MCTDRYVVKSLELHLFFGRIMKEHALFLRAGFTPADQTFSGKADFFKREFERLLSQAVTLSNGIISESVLASGEIITEFTARAERQTERFTGIAINKELTAKELRLRSRGCDCVDPSGILRQVRQLNHRALRLSDGLISLKESILNRVLQCKMFTMNYPLLIEHILREAKLYRDYVIMLENNGELTEQSMKQTECFWNRIMMEHALFIRGLLDPCETELFQTADDFARDYCELLDASRNAHNQALATGSLEKTLAFRDFKAAGTQGLTQCRIRSVILPLLADHVLREANHYIRLLGC